MNLQEFLFKINPFAKASIADAGILVNFFSGTIGNAHPYYNAYIQGVEYKNTVDTVMFTGFNNTNGSTTEMGNNVVLDRNATQVTIPAGSVIGTINTAAQLNNNNGVDNGTYVFFKRQDGSFYTAQDIYLSNADLVRQNILDAAQVQQLTIDSNNRSLIPSIPNWVIPSTIIVALIIVSLILLPYFVKKK